MVFAERDTDVVVAAELKLDDVSTFLAILDADTIRITRYGRNSLPRSLSIKIHRGTVLEANPVYANWRRPRKTLYAYPVTVKGLDV